MRISRNPSAPIRDGCDPSAPIARIETSPTATKSLTPGPRIARLHSSASCPARSPALTYPSFLQVTAKRTLPMRSQLMPIVL